MYIPKPLDTSDISLPEALLELTERLAENTHDQWAKLRLQEGWRYGPRRSDQEKTNPCLVPYEDLPESEKAYDRSTAMESIKLLIKLGYQIRRADSQEEILK